MMGGSHSGCPTIYKESNLKHKNERKKREKKRTNSFCGEWLGNKMQKSKK